ncbi:unnamed protein product [Agarophyton chilense]
MRIVAHNGPNWTRDSLATSQQFVAIAVRNTVQIYSHNTAFETELRATGSPARIASISFCNAACLTSLLAVASQSGHVRVFDVDARRIFRVVCDGGAPCFAVRFLENMPFRVLVVSDSLCVFDIVKKVRLVVRRSLPLKKIFLVELIPNVSSNILVAGKRDTGACLCVVNVYDENESHTLVTGFAVHDVAIRYRPNHVHPYLMAVACEGVFYPMLFTSQDGVQWAKLPDMKPHVPHHIRNTDKYEKQKKHLYSQSLRTAVCWDADQILYTSNARGTIFAWQLNDASQLQFFAQRRYAHTRQIFSIKSVSSKIIFSISMDRTLAKWHVTEAGQPSLALQWRSLRTHGPVTALSMSTRLQRADECYIAYTTGSNSVACVKWTPHEHQFFLEAEASPSNLALGKRKRGTISYVTTLDQLFDDSFAAVKEEHETLFVFGFAEGKRGTFTITDGKVTVSPLQSDSSVTLRQALVADPTSESRKTFEPTNNSSVPSAMSERKKKREVGMNNSVSLSMLENVLENDKVTSACLLPARGPEKGEQMCYLLGSEKGLLYFLSKEQKITLVSTSLAASSILCIEYEPVSSLISVSDTNGVLFTLKWCETESSCQTSGTEGQVCENSVNRYELSSPIRFMRWSSQASDEDSLASVSTYLLLALQNGETHVWSSDNKGRLSLRTKLREHRGRVNGAVLFESKYILTAGEDGTVRFWEIDRLPQSK